MQIGGVIMGYPQLVPKWLCKTPIHISLESEELDRYGNPTVSIELDAMCNYQDCAKRVLTEQQQVIELTAIALLPGDIAPQLPVISGGSVVVFGVKRRIYEGRKARNPDGTVNYTELRLI